jgi:hypothetical protein
MSSFRRLIPAVLVLTLVSTACFNTESPWADPEGQVVSATRLLEYRGLPRCSLQRVTFLQFLGRQYAHDPRGVLGELTSVDGAGRALTFAFLTEAPPGTEPTGFTRGDREIYLGGDVEDYLYIVRPSVVERWPRAEVYCEGQYRPRG